MKRVLWILGGICAAGAGFLVLGSRRVQPVQELAARLEEAWAERRTAE